MDLALPESAREPVVQSIRTTKIRPQHRERTAIVYVRQSTPQQVIGHQESGLRQYDLAAHAMALGWSQQRVLVIDEDQGQSGRSAQHRTGFQRLLAEVTLEHVGLVLGLEMSRLARSSKDWHHLLELCALFGTLLGDQDGVYDPTDSNDRLLLGLKGTMSEFELFTMRNRLERGRLHKAERGELFFTAPMGYVLLSSGEIIKEPDEQARAVTQLILDKFTEIGTAYGVLHYLVKQGIELGIRPKRGPRRDELTWRRPTLSMIFRVLHHPWYAGAYAYGRHATERKAVGGVVRAHVRTLPQSQWKVLKKDVLPAYITWEQYQANQERLRQNLARCDSRGAARCGDALLGGILVCGTCGRRLRPNYSNANKPYYLCASHLEKALDRTCAGLCSGAIDQLVAGQLFKALEPAALELSLQVLEDEHRERTRLHQHWEHQRERAQYETQRAERQFQAVEPENRLVGRTLEAKWEEALRKQHELDDEWRRFAQATPQQLSNEERQRITALSQDVKTLWNAAGTTNADRKEILRCLVDRVVVHVKQKSERVDVTIHWQGGFTSQHEFLRPVGSYQRLAAVGQLRQRVTELRGAGNTCQQIAQRLNEEGYSPPQRCNPFSREQVWLLLRRYGLTKKLDAVQLAPHEWKLPQLATLLGVPIVRMRYWAHKGWVHARQTPTQGLWIAWADADEVERLRRLTARSKHGVCGHPPDLTTPKPRPQAAHACCHSRHTGTSHTPGSSQ
jgi:DNA invertase Pin-like site-specific DNA recombinase